MFRRPTRTRITAYAALALVLCTPAITADEPHDFAQDHIIVKFDRDAVQRRVGQLRHVEKSRVMAALDLPAGCNLIESKFATLQRSREKRRVAAADPVSLDRFVRITVPPDMTVGSLVDLMNARDDVAYAEPDGYATGGAFPNDTDFALQWHHNNTGYTGGSVSSDIQSTNLWELSTGFSNVIVAVLDTGLALTNEEFTGRLVPGYDFVNNDADSTDDETRFSGHGTKVTSFLAANANNTNHVAGVNWQCRIMPVKVLAANNNGLYSDMADAIDFAVSNGADVINFSIGGPSSDVTLSNAIMNAIAEGVIFVTITHNYGVTPSRFPGRMKQCITVSATGTNDEWASFSNFGPATDLCGPGRDMVTIDRFGSLSVSNAGTSYACPLVAGVAAIIKGFRPDITQQEMEAILCASADDQVGGVEDTPGWDPYHGWGRLNAYNAVVMAMSSNRFVHDGMGNFTLSWDSPPNASNRTPFQVQAANSITGTWTTVAASNDVTYTPSEASWPVSGLAGSNVLLRVLTRPH